MTKLQQQLPCDPYSVVVMSYDEVVGCCCSNNPAVVLQDKWLNTLSLQGWRNGIQRDRLIRDALIPTGPHCAAETRAAESRAAETRAAATCGDLAAVFEGHLCLAMLSMSDNQWNINDFSKCRHRGIARQPQKHVCTCIVLSNLPHHFAVAVAMRPKRACVL